MHQKAVTITSRGDGPCDFEETFRGVFSAGEIRGNVVDAVYEDLETKAFLSLLVVVND